MADRQAAFERGWGDDERSASYRESVRLLNEDDDNTLELYGTWKELRFPLLAHPAARNYIDLLLSKGADPNESFRASNSDGWRRPGRMATPLLLAVEAGLVDDARKMMMHGGDPTLLAEQHVTMRGQKIGPARSALEIAEKTAKSQRQIYNDKVNRYKGEINRSKMAVTENRLRYEIALKNTQAMERADRMYEFLRSSVKPTKAARSRAQIARALQKANGNHKAAARLLFEGLV